ncbi:CACTA en-spm transposon protein [Cucumis melo var. makuwa]|uniref:CACTA en-spm transposon protein n=1 Tax=Cucumis melo var. makuwa TaxID=1194695 RepID=A0A5D3CRC0_CUCMM|nr:CACTA en-spm transposon protein [Cucumis melo var. makuwa]
METDDMFLQFEDDLDNNIAGGSSSVGDNTGSSSQQTTPTPRRRAQSRLLELERHVAINGRIPMTIAPGAEKPISPHAVRFSQAIGVCVRKTFPVRCLKWTDVGREYIEVVKGDLQTASGIRFSRRRHADASPGVGKGFPDADLVRRRESLSRRISPDVLPDVVLFVGISFPDVLCIFADVFVRREYPRLL